MIHGNNIHLALQLNIQLYCRAILSQQFTFNQFTIRYKSSHLDTFSFSRLPISFEIFETYTFELF